MDEPGHNESDGPVIRIECVVRIHVNIPGRHQCQALSANGSATVVRQSNAMSLGDFKSGATLQIIELFAAPEGFPFRAKHFVKMAVRPSAARLVPLHTPPMGEPNTTFWARGSTGGFSLSGVCYGDGTGDPDRHAGMARCSCRIS